MEILDGEHDVPPGPFTPPSWEGFDEMIQNHDVFFICAVDEREVAVRSGKIVETADRGCRMTMTMAYFLKDIADVTEKTKWLDFILPKRPSERHKSEMNSMGIEFNSSKRGLEKDITFRITSTAPALEKLKFWGDKVVEEVFEDCINFNFRKFCKEGLEGNWKRNI